MNKPTQKLILNDKDWGDVKMDGIREMLPPLILQLYSIQYDVGFIVSIHGLFVACLSGAFDCVPLFSKITKDGSFDNPLTKR